MKAIWVKLLILALALPALTLPVACFGYILWQGLPGLNWQTFSGEGMSGFGLEHGLYGQLTGSLLLMLGASIVAAPVALGSAIFSRLYLNARMQTHITTLLHLMQGIPPIVYGLCGLVVFVHMLHWGISLLAGMIILAVIIMPVLLLNCLLALQRIPDEHSEAARSLGLNHARLILRVWLPQAWPAMLTGLLLGMARALSETAPILFTATVFSGVVWPDSLLSPVSTLQTHIFYLAQEGANAQVVGIAWTAAILLIGLVLLFSTSALLLRRMDKHQRIDL
ncbi:MAG: ABC transporter permease subunit [Mariprofundaceae bacterium]|nr:ABC transporter permease subunit [Mariprofundaceae bacterium]